MNYGESVRSIYVKGDTTPAERSPALATRALRLGAALALGTALFAASAPARADDGLPIGNITGNDVATTVSEVQTAGLADVSAAVESVAPDASSSATDASPSQTSAPQSGSGSGVVGGISAATPTAVPEIGSPGTQTEPTQDTGHSGGASAAVVAPATPVVSPVSAAATPVTVTQPQHAAPSAALHALAAQYQKNPGRYQSLNSPPISRRTASKSALDSLVKRSRSLPGSSPQKSPPIPLPKCLQALPQSVLQHECQDVLAQVSGADLTAVAGVSGAAHAQTGGSTRPQHRPAPRHPHAPTASTPPAPAWTEGTSGRNQPSLGSHFVSPIAPAAVALRRKRPPARSESTSAATPAQPRAAQPSSSRLALRQGSSQRESARTERSTTPLWSDLGLVLLLVGITSIALAAGSLGSGGAAVVGAIVARVRDSRPGGATGIATRLRSKGLSAAATTRPGERRRARPGIRYRE